MSKAQTLATTVSTGNVLADGTVVYAEVSGTPTLPTFPSGTVVGTTDTQTLTNKTIDASNNTLIGVQESLVSGTNIKTIGGTSLLGSGDLPLPSPAPEFVASGAIASAGLAVSLRSDGKVEVTTGQSYSASVGTPVSPNNQAASVNRITSVYDPVNNKVVVAWAISSTGQAAVGTVSGSTITFGSIVTFINESVDNITSSYDTANSKVVIVCNGNNNYIRAIVGTVSGTVISFGSVANQNDPSQYTTSVYDSVSGKIVIVSSNYTASDVGNVYLATVSGTSISISYAGNLGNYVNYPNVVADTVNQKIVVFFSDTNNSDRGSAAVGTISGSSITFTGGRIVFETTTASDLYSLYIPTIGKSVVINNGKVRICTLSAGVPTFTAPTSFSTSGSEFAAIAYDSGQEKIVIVYKENGSSTGKYVSGTISSSGIALGSSVTWLNTNPQWLNSAIYDPLSTKVIPSYQNGSTGDGFSVAIQVEGIATNANNFIGFSQSSATDGATLKVATEANVNENQSGLITKVKYYINFDGTLTSTPTIYPIAGTALSDTRIQVATTPEFDPSTPPGAWKLIASVAASSTSSVNFNGYITSDYTTYKVVLDNVKLSAYSFPRIRAYVANTLIGSGYGYIGHAGQGTNISVFGATNDGLWNLSPNGFDHSWTAEFTITATEAGKKPVVRWHYGTGTSTSDAGFGIFGGMLNNTGVVTGLLVYPTSGNIASGNIKLYGLV